MATQNLSSAQILYSRHFPELLSADSTLEEYKVSNPLNGYKNEMTIDKFGMYEAHNPPSKGFVNQFLQLAEGLIAEEDEAFFEELKQGKASCSLEEISNLHNNLFKNEGKSAFDYLVNERGLTIDTIKKYRLGFDINARELVIPALNITRKNPIAVKYLAVPNSLDQKPTTLRTIGYSYLLGYHKLKFANNSSIPKYIVLDELDALYLRQWGLEVYCSMTFNCEMMKEWCSLFHDSDVIIFADHSQESQTNTWELANYANSITLVRLSEPCVSDYFVKKKHTLTDLLERVKDGQKLDSNYFVSMRTLRIVEEKKDPSEYINGPQDLTQNYGFVYGAKIDGDYYYLSSSRVFYDEQVFSDTGVYKKHEFELSEISEELAEKYTQGNKTIKISDLFAATREYIKKYIFFQQDQIYDLLTVWAMGTYVFTLFRHFPYIHIQADKNSGKTQLMEVLRPICFNGKSYVNPTGAVIFRDAECNLPTMFIDEAERLGSRNSQGPLMELLNTGFQKGATVSRIAPAGKGGFVTFSVYCPKMFAGINDMNEVLQSRSIDVMMTRKLPNEIVATYRFDSSTTKQQIDIKENMYLFGLQSASIIKRTYDTKLDAIPQLAALENRQHDIWSPLFVISSIIDFENKNTKISDALSVLASAQATLQLAKDEQENPSARLLLFLDEVLNRVKYFKKKDAIIEYRTEEIFNEFMKDPDWKRTVPTKNKLTSELRKVGIDTKNEAVNNKTERCYLVDIERLVDLGKRNKVEIGFYKRIEEPGAS